MISLLSNNDLRLHGSFRGLATADFYAEKLGLSVGEVQRLEAEEREHFYQLLDQHSLRVTVTPESLA